MICPYCVEDIPPNSRRHVGCKRLKGKDENKEFPKEYLKYHGHKGDKEPVIFSIVGFKNHGKTVYLCSLFDYLDHVLVEKWPGFYNDVSIDEDSLKTLQENSDMLRNGKLPDHTKENFPRPGIFRLKNMPHMEDTTILIYDPPGEAFERGLREFSEMASFVKRSSCVLFLIDIAELRKLDESALVQTVADKMAALLNIYTLWMGDNDIAPKSQHLIVVYTKADELKFSFNIFRNYLDKNYSDEHLNLNEYLNERVPDSLSDLRRHLVKLGEVSRLLKDFTISELKAIKFDTVTQTYFKSVTYTAVSALGSRPEIDAQGVKTLKFQMSPRCVADPLLHVLDKSIPPPRKWWQRPVILFALILIIIAILLTIVMILSSPSEESQTSSATTTSSPELSGTPGNTPRVAINTASTPASLPKTPVSLSGATNLMLGPTDDGAVILKMPRTTMVIPLEEKTDSTGKKWVKIKIENQDCQIGAAVYDACTSVVIARYEGWIRVMHDEEHPIITWSGEISNIATLEMNAYVRNQAGDNTGIPVLMLYKGQKVTLTGKQQTIGDYEWRKLLLKNQRCCVSPPDVADKEQVFTVRVAQAEGWIDKNLLNL